MVERVAGIDIAWEQVISKYFFFSAVDVEL